MSLSLANIRLFTRIPPTFIRSSRRNATTTSNNTNQVPIIRPNQTYMKAGALILGVVGVLALLRASRKEEQLIEQTINHQHEPPVATSHPK